MKKLLLILVFSGCVKTFIAPDGSTWHETECDESGLSYCYKKASYECPQGYDILEKRIVDKGVTAETIDYTLADGTQYFPSETKYKRNTTVFFTFKCK